MDKIPIYCTYNATGKTYFCKHNLGWADLDEEFFHKTYAPYQMPLLMYELYYSYGYKILTNASPYTLNALKTSDKFEVYVIVPAPEMREEIIQRIRDRGNNEWADYLDRIYDSHWGGVYNDTQYKHIVLKPGQYLSDVLNPDGTFK